MKMKNLFIAGVIALAAPSVAVAGPGMAQKTAPAALSDLERGELIHRHHVNVMEIEMGKLAKKHGTAPVKKYGAMLVTDHTTADKGVRALAKARGVKLTAMPMPGDGDEADHQKAMDLMATLKTLDSAAFDSEYLAAMVDGHTAEQARVSAALPQVTDAKVKALLDKTLPSLQKHADGAKALQAPVPPTMAPAK